MSRNIEAFLDIERDGKTLELLVTADCSPAEHDVGIFGTQIEGMWAEDLTTKQPVELTKEEADRAEENIRDKYESLCMDYD